MRSCRVLKSKKCEITQEFIPGRHYGIDLTGAGYTLDKIIAHTGGTIIQSIDGLDNMPNSRSYGNHVIISHGNNLYTLYAHMNKGTVRVKVGDKVKKGQILGDMGNSGNSYGAHLHFEVRINDKKINPIDYLNNDLVVNSNSEKSTEELAKEVIKGVYGNGDVRKAALGSRYDEVQALVNSMLTPKKDDNNLLVLVINTIRGNYGNGEYRKQILGGRYNEVQRQINLNYQNGTVNNPRLY